MDTLGVVESKGIAAGVELADGMMKVADVELVRASTICGGRYLIYVSGDREAVETAVNLARNSERALTGSFVISNVSPQVVAVLKKGTRADAGDALGVVECRSVSSGVAAADVAVKRAPIGLLRFAAGQGINGKSYFVVSGDAASVREATEAAKAALETNFIEAVVILRPDASVVKALTSGMR